MKVVNENFETVENENENNENKLDEGKPMSVEVNIDFYLCIFVYSIIVN